MGYATARCTRAMTRRPARPRTLDRGRSNYSQAKDLLKWRTFGGPGCITTGYVGPALATGHRARPDRKGAWATSSELGICSAMNTSPSGRMPHTRRSLPLARSFSWNRTASPTTRPRPSRGASIRSVPSRARHQVESRPPPRRLSVGGVSPTAVPRPRPGSPRRIVDHCVIAIAGSAMLLTLAACDTAGTPVGGSSDKDSGSSSAASETSRLPAVRSECVHVHVHRTGRAEPGRPRGLDPLQQP